MNRAISFVFLALFFTIMSTTIYAQDSYSMPSQAEMQHMMAQQKKAQQMLASPEMQKQMQQMQAQIPEMRRQMEEAGMDPALIDAQISQMTAFQSLGTGGALDTITQGMELSECIQNGIGVERMQEIAQQGAALSKKVDALCAAGREAEVRKMHVDIATKFYTKEEQAVLSRCTEKYQPKFDDKYQPKFDDKHNPDSDAGVCPKL